MRDALPRTPLTPDEIKRRHEALKQFTTPEAASSMLVPTHKPEHQSQYAEGVESCIRTIYGALPAKKAEVFRIMAAEALNYMREAGFDESGVVDRLQEAAEAIDLVREYGQDLVQQWLADACSPTLRSIAQSINDNVVSFPAPTQLTKRALISHRSSEVEPERIQWVWPGRVAAGKLTLIGGKPGLGKSQLTTAIAAAVSNGASWPCDEGRAPQGNVVIFSAEDGIADTIVPRLISIGADRSRIIIVSGVADVSGRKTFNLKADIDLLEAKVKEMGDVRLIIIDPISAYMGNADGNGNVETRAVLEPIADMANRLGIAVIAVTHLNKGGVGSQGAMERFAGSIAFVAAARAGFVVVEDDENEGRLLFLQVKNNIAKRQKGLAFRLEQQLIEDSDIVASRVVWDGQHVERTADEALAANEGRGGERSSKDEAVAFLRDLLTVRPLPVKEIEAQAVEAGLLPEGKPISQSKAFRSAREMLGIKPSRDGGAAAAGRWVWGLPDA